MNDGHLQSPASPRPASAVYLYAGSSQAAIKVAMAAVR